MWSCLYNSFIYISRTMVGLRNCNNECYLGVYECFSGPSYKAFTKEIVKKDSISQLNSVLETTSTVIKVTVPMAAIFLYNLLGIHGVLLLDGLSFLIAALLIFFIVPVNEE